MERSYFISVHTFFYGLYLLSYQNS